MNAVAWYERLRQQYRPPQLELLLIAESPPDPGCGERRFFYSPILRADNLYRGVAQALYGLEPDFDIRNKPAVLDRMRGEGVWLIDAVDMPVNHLEVSARTAAIGAGVPRLVARCLELEPRRGVIVCHSKVYAAAANRLRAAGVTLLHDKPLPFPLGNWRAQFIDGFRHALASGH